MGRKGTRLLKSDFFLRDSPSSFDLKQNLIVLKNNIFPDECHTSQGFKVYCGTVLGGRISNMAANLSPKTVPQCTLKPFRPGLPQPQSN